MSDSDKTRHSGEPSRLRVRLPGLTFEASGSPNVVNESWRRAIEIYHVCYGRPAETFENGSGI